MGGTSALKRMMCIRLFWIFLLQLFTPSYSTDESVWDCNFDAGSFCEFYNSGETKNGYYTWKVLSGSTPSTYTGPSDDFFGGGYYMYVESGYNLACSGHRLQLDFGRAFTGIGISFAYHLYGSNMGTFKLMTSQDGTNWDTIWMKEGNYATGWLYTTVAISDNPVSIQFVSFSFLLFFFYIQTDDNCV